MLRFCGTTRAIGCTWPQPSSASRAPLWTSATIGCESFPRSAGLWRGVEIDAYDDHRVAMAFSLVGDVVIRDPSCVAKLCPTNFEHVELVGMVAPPDDPAPSIVDLGFARDLNIPTGRNLFARS